MDALKEWATVVKALENGDQTVLLRKGGILETGSGFKVESDKFFLFPTFEHQELKNIKPQFQNYLDNVKKTQPRNGVNKITSYAKVLDEKDVESKEKIDALSSFHIWSEDYIQTRINWMPEKPLSAIFLKVYKVNPFEIPIKSEYQGCKSWININEEINSGESVLDESKLELKLKEFQEIVN